MLKEALNRQEIISDVSFEVISEELKIKICHKVKMKCKENVVGALFRDSKDTLYSFSKKGEYIQLNPLVYRRILFEEFEERTCFYCGKELKYGEIGRSERVSAR